MFIRVLISLILFLGILLPQVINAEEEWGSGGINSFESWEKAKAEGRDLRAESIAGLDMAIEEAQQQNQQNLYRNDEYHFRIKFPAGWEIKDGDGEHVVKKAVKDGSTVLVVVWDLSISLSEEEKNSLSDKDKQDAQTFEFNDFNDQEAEDFSNEIVNGMLEGFPGSKTLEKNIGHIDNRKAIYFKINQVYKVQNLQVEGISINYCTIHKGKLFQIGGFYPKGSDYQESTIKTSLMTFVFEDWNDASGVTGTNNKSEDTKTTSGESYYNLISEKSWGVLAVVLITSILFTWGFGLLIPILFRFVFLKKPLSRGISVMIAGVVWLMQFIISGAFDSSGRHTALILVAFVSYQIMRSGSKKEVKYCKYCGKKTTSSVCSKCSAVSKDKNKR